MSELALPKAVLLDLDDTILMYDAVVEESWRATCEHFADYAGIDAETLYRTLRAQADWFWNDPDRHRQGRLDLLAARAQIANRALQQLGIEDEELALAMGRMRTEMHERAIEPFPDAIETLHALHGRGISLALITNGAAETQGRKIERFNLRPLFDCIVIEGEFGTGKPDARVFQHALATCNAAPTEAWMVGDNLALDIAPAQALGIYAIWHDFRAAGLPLGHPVTPDRIITRLAELVEEPSYLGS